MMGNNYIASRAGMSDQEWESYTSHLAKRAREEQEKLDYERASLRSYRESLIEDIMKRYGDRFTREELQKKSTRSLEMTW